MAPLPTPAPAPPMPLPLPDALPPKRAPYAPRTARGTFQPGYSGNPGGKPPGSKVRVGKRIFDRLEEDAGAILETVIQRAKEGSGQDARFLLSLFVPKAKTVTPDIGGDSLPSLTDAEGIAETHAALIRAAASGRIDADAANALSSLLNAQRDHVQTVHLAKKLERLERGGAPMIEVAPIDEGRDP